MKGWVYADVTVGGSIITQHLPRAALCPGCVKRPWRVVLVRVLVIAGVRCVSRVGEGVGQSVVWVWWRLGGGCIRPAQLVHRGGAEVVWGWARQWQ